MKKRRLNVNVSASILKRKQQKQCASRKKQQLPKLKEYDSKKKKLLPSRKQN